MFSILFEPMKLEPTGESLSVRIIEETILGGGAKELEDVLLPVDDSATTVAKSRQKRKNLKEYFFLINSKLISTLRIEIAYEISVFNANSLFYNKDRKIKKILIRELISESF